jgi:hypothetical protein
MMMKREEKSWSYWLSNFFVNYLWLGIVIILVAIILDKYFPHKSLPLDILINLVHSIGIAIVVASIFSFASGTSHFIEKVKNLLEDIVISKRFLSNIDSSSKREAIQAIIKPSDIDKSIYQNIGSYYDEQITKTLEVTKKCVRSNYNIYGKAFFDSDKKLIGLQEDISYRLFPSLDGYSDIEIIFSDEEVPSRCDSVKICTPNGQRKELSPPHFEKCNIGGVNHLCAKINLVPIHK